jgi:outer membrane protein OmpA-like peptidoglycan-associated protein
MLGNRIAIKRGARDEGEKPFWISFADLMTSLMVLFLIAMSVALVAVTKKTNEEERQRNQRRDDIAKILSEIENATASYDGITVDRNRNVIDFGGRARFGFNSDTLSSDQSRLMRLFVPKVLNIARMKLGSHWLKRIVIEGFTDQRGTYLYNLNLSLRRSQRVLCVLLAPPTPGERAMSSEEREQIRKLFLVGGYSSNSAMASLDASRRIELRLEFFEVNEDRKPAPDATSEIGDCAI